MYVPELNCGRSTAVVSETRGIYTSSLTGWGCTARAKEMHEKKIERELLVLNYLQLAATWKEKVLRAQSKTYLHIH